MKQKYSLFRKEEGDVLVIKEYAELEKERLSLLCEETYEDKVIKSAIANGTSILVATLRTHNMYPPGIYMHKIAEAVTILYGSENSQTLDVFLDDKDLLIKAQEALEEVDAISIVDTEIEADAIDEIDTA